jgi:hypothetical protein
MPEPKFKVGQHVRVKCPGTYIGTICVITTDPLRYVLYPYTKDDFYRTHPDGWPRHYFEERELELCDEKTLSDYEEQCKRIPGFANR